MSPLLLPSFRKQQLVLDFSCLKDKCPEGIYLSLTPNNPSVWPGILFVRKGPYAGALLRFQLSIPDGYPSQPPLITFSSDIFHPLVVPLTTYTFSGSAVDALNTVSASDEGRLPPGTFSLRSGFPHWFRRTSAGSELMDVFGTTTEGDAEPTSDETTQLTQPGNDGRHGQEEVDRKELLLSLLSHLKQAFENEDFLDNLPLDTAGDPSAWHAWRAHRGLTSRIAPPKGPTSPKQKLRSDSDFTASPRNIAEWKWDGVWESRVRNGIEASISEAALFGTTAAPGKGSAVFSRLNDEQLDQIFREAYS